jgi:DNA (cytosine-5)-methyltransferase 1
MENRPAALDFYEFFAGGGMARAGLGPDWRCLLANDLDAKKASAYRENWGSGDFRLADIAALRAADLPGHADLAWASFPCQDLSLAGAGAGLGGKRSGTFWEFRRLIAELAAEARAPGVLVLENVCGALASDGGRDFARICAGLTSLDYHIGAMVIDAASFVPQSRPRLFIVASRDPGRLAHLRRADPDPMWTTQALRRAHAFLSPDVRKRWVWWRLPPPPARGVRLRDLIDRDPPDANWRSAADTQKLIAMMSDANRLKFERAVAEKFAIGAVYRRTRRGQNGARAQRAEVRFDGLAGCLRTPAGGSSRQTILVVEGGSVRSRLLTAREAARLMGLPETYRLPANYNDAYHLVGDGVAVPVVAHLSRHLLAPLCAPAAAPIAA